MKRTGTIDKLIKRTDIRSEQKDIDELLSYLSAEAYESIIPSAVSEKDVAKFPKPISRIITIKASVSASLGASLNKARNIDLKHTMQSFFKKVLKKRVRKIKAAARKHKVYTSILIIPHESQKKKVREMRIHAPFLKLTAVFLTLALTAAATTLYIKNINTQNKRLNNEVAMLSGFIYEQNNLIAYRAGEISKLEIIEDVVNEKINEFTEKYTDMAETYLRNRSETALASRGGERNDKDFIAELNDMRSIMSTMKEIKEIDDSFTPKLEDIERKLQTYINSIPTMAPVDGAITSGFGYRRDPITHLRRFHEGVDFHASHGTSIRASASGEIIETGWNDGFGYYVRVDHGNGISTTYAHCCKILVKVGSYVKKGAVIAKVGNTGRSTGPHLHFEVKMFGTKINPCKFLYK